MTASWAGALAAIPNASLVIVLDLDLDDAEAATISAAHTLVHLAAVPDARLASADLVLPVATMAEEQGVYVNRDGRAQRFLPARPAPGMARTAWWIASQAWQRGGAGRTAPATAAEAFAALDAFGGLSYRDLGLVGRPLRAPAGAVS
jgi:predicted molibdopterin-dependent oxidoreductase YjgC